MKKIAIIASIAILVFTFNGAQYAVAQTLDNYLQEGSESNPKLQAAYADFEAAMQKAPQMASLPDPTLTMSAFGRMIETRVGTQEARFSLMQMFPWFGTLEAKNDAAVLMAEAAFQRYLNLRSELFFELKSVYAELYALDETIRIQQENLEILDSYRELALARFESGDAPMANVLKVDIKRDALRTEIELIQDRRKPLQADFNLMLNRELNAEVIVEDTLVFKSEKSSLLTEEQFGNHPAIIRLEKQQQAYQLQETVAKKEGLPMIGLGLDYSLISKRDVEGLENNGRDAIMPMLSITLPIYRKKYRASVKEAELKGKSVQLQMLSGKNALRSDFEMARYELNKAKKQLDLYERQLKSAAQANKLLVSGFSNNVIDFQEVLQMNEDILMFQIQKIEALKNGKIAEARIDYLFSKSEDHDN